MQLEPQHSGGKAWSVVVDDSGTTVVATDSTRDAHPRQYLHLTASPDNTGPVFLHLHETNAAVYGEGIPLYPNDAYEIHSYNLYRGAIRGVTAPGTTGKVYAQEGR